MDNSFKMEETNNNYDFKLLNNSSNLHLDNLESFSIDLDTQPTLYDLTTPLEFKPWLLPTDFIEPNNTLQTQETLLLPNSIVYNPVKTEIKTDDDVLILEPNEVENKPQNAFHVDMSAIPSIPMENQAEELWNLGISVYDQTQLEEGVLAQVETKLKKQEEASRQKHVEVELKELNSELKSVKMRLVQINKALSMAPKKDLSKVAKRQIEAINREKENKLKQKKRLEVRNRCLLASIGCQAPDANSEDPEVLNCKLDAETKFQLEKVFSAETNSDKLIRSGEMTPFGTMMAPKIKLPTNEPTGFEVFLMEQVAQKAKTKKTPIKTIPKCKEKVKSIPEKTSGSHKNIQHFESQPSTSKDFSHLITNKVKLVKKKKPELLGSKFANGIPKSIRSSSNRSLNINYSSDHELSDPENGDVNYDKNDFEKNSDEDYLPENEEIDSDCEMGNRKRKINDVSVSEEEDVETPWVSVKGKQRTGSDDLTSKKAEVNSRNRIVDDGNEKSYLKRLKEHKMERLLRKQGKETNTDEENEAVELTDEFKVPAIIWNKLYRYQQTGVRWLWELHQQNCGGIIGDEMGLGKTIQVIVFLAGLKISQIQTNGDRFQGLGPVILVCPATVMYQWVKEFHKWWPPIRVAVLHESGSFGGKKGTLIKYINESCGIIITSYAGLTSYQENLLKYDWHYVILDEGHKIRNPDAKVTIAVKQIRTPHRIILSGSPMQNNLKELWSLFDFVFPGKLGTLPVFMQEFSVPITQGGYANASEVQVQTAYKCAVVLRNTIKPYLIRRMKSDVQMSLQLPSKSEQVLFCKLTDEQRNLYKDYLASADISSIIDGKFQIFVGLINLRKICNHPDIFTGGPKVFQNSDVSTLKDDQIYGHFKRSGKMVVVSSLLKLWKQQQHRVLLFTQSRLMLQIFETFMKKEGYTYMSMDGTTTIASRQPAINKFNSDPDVFVFILTTKVGGLGVNLTGANRIIIYDPDWNPSTDIQSRERAWRIGQTKQVTVYRLLTAGTIEEKIYHRQIFKLFLTNRILKDPRQRRFFKTNDLHELFTLGEEDKQGNETSAIFAGTGSDVKLQDVKAARKNSKKEMNTRVQKIKDQFSFTSKKIDKMKEMAKKLSQRLTGGGTDVKPEDQEKTDEKLKDESKNSEHRKKKRRKNALDGIEFEGQKISNLLKQEIFKSSQAESETQDTQQDEYILQKLFKKSNVQSAMKHDNIVDSADPDYVLVEGEAERVAKEAVLALKRSRRECQKASFGVPTWTGSHGASGAPLSVRNRFGAKKHIKIMEPSTKESNSILNNKTESTPSTSGLGIAKKKPLPLSFETTFENSPKLEATPMSSAELLSLIRKRNQKSVKPRKPDDSSSSDDSDNNTPLGPSTEYDELLCDIRNFIAFQSNKNGQASTSELLSAFKEKVPRNDTPVFKAMLSRICTFYRVREGEGVWKLRYEFR